MDGCQKCVKMQKNFAKILHQLNQKLFIRILLYFKISVLNKLFTFKLIYEIDYLIYY